MKRPKPKYRHTAATRARTCPGCGYPIQIGEHIRETEKVSRGRLVHGEMMWVHNDCRGRDVIARQKAAAATRVKERLEWK